MAENNGQRYTQEINCWRVWYDSGQGGEARGDYASFFCDVVGNDPAEAIEWTRAQFGGTAWTLREVERVTYNINTEMATFDQRKGYGYPKLDKPKKSTNERQPVRPSTAREIVPVPQIVPPPESADARRDIPWRPDCGCTSERQCDYHRSADARTPVPAKEPTWTCPLGNVHPADMGCGCLAPVPAADQPVRETEPDSGELQDRAFADCAAELEDYFENVAKLGGTDRQEVIDILLLYFVDRAAASTPSAPGPDTLSASEGIYGFAGWLTTRKEREVFSRRDSAARIAELVNEFCTVNKLAPPREQWERVLVHPKEKGKE